MNRSKHDRHLPPTEIIRGKMVSLRLPRLEEMSFVRALWSDADTMAAVGGPVELPEEKATRWFARMVEPGGRSNCYCLVFDEDDIPIGEISFHNWDPDHRSADLNVKILASHRGHGYAKDALSVFLGFFFGRVGGQLMIDDVAPENQPGQRLLASTGFMSDDRVLDAHRMRMTRHMYVERYGEPNRLQ